MYRLLLRRPQVRFKSNYPLVQIEELRTHTLRSGETATIPMRDYYEWETMPDIMKRERFFTARNPSLASTMEDLVLYDPIVTHCIANWLLVDYKLNAYPYYDLNIVNVFTDVQQAVRIVQSMMSYFQSALSRNMFERIKYFIVPLYSDHVMVTEEQLTGIPGDVRLVENAALFPPNGSNMSMDKPFSIEDPVYVLLLNDIIKNLSHDLVEYSDSIHKWSQAFMDIHADGTSTKRFDTDMDFWCSYTLKMTLGQDKNNVGQSKTGIHIPTRLVQLFEMIKLCAPEHKLFAIDIPQRWEPSLWSMIKFLLGGGPAPTSQIAGNNLGRKSAHFISDFTQVQQIYSEVNERGKYCEIQDLSEFVDQWVDLGEVEKYSSATKDRLDAQLETIQCSNLGVLHST
ncbi:ZYBA0S08-01904g1_1 [Zygosaccharomyces bailii CLIB 213]|uniref:type II protein arginine methyltransferase n=1 Tax=Zygosaccharomyces bailii (strain CLIB 213 / ATCC 58445 / CBS 680 / BCRC 21525 / NBRC 1098 / NCYC 1416 / NRRL Y-2227) TaxID=1333698 RepID=A0A8J2TAU9_ZYGB2|nr:ZYBA0S08-01904g1_1 [Zygosaccharomyces bailii CLIB 213]